MDKIYMMRSPVKLIDELPEKINSAEKKYEPI